MAILTSNEELFRANKCLGACVQRPSHCFGKLLFARRTCSQEIQSHAFRHIVAHSYLKSNPKVYVVVRDILNDELETVMEEYGHLGITDNFKHWLAFTRKRRSGSGFRLQRKRQERAGARMDRGLIHEAALRGNVDPNTLSFFHAVRVIRRKLHVGP